MPPQIALLACSFLVLGLLIVDSRRKPRASVALWIPLIWLAILVSRPVGAWFDPGTMRASASVEEGSPLDRTILSVLMVIAAFILATRKLHWARWLKQNIWIVLFFLYCGMSIAWSDFPEVASKRWIRGLGSVMMILVVLSEVDPVAAVGTLIRRCTYILVPVSVVLIKYYREAAVRYNEWTGQEALVGVTTDKNALGRLCLVAGLFLLWDILATRQTKSIRGNMLNWFISIMMCLMTLGLLVKSNSATSISSFFVGVCAMIGLGVSIVRNRIRHIGTLIVVTSSVVVILGLSLNLTEIAVKSLGRDMTLTERTYVWEDLLGMGTNALVGVGYDSFWLGERLDEFVRRHGVNEAHNGYLEVYLELGSIGVGLLATLLLSVFRRAKVSLSSNFDYGRLRMVMLFMFLMYNVTESGYKVTTLMFFILLLVGIDSPTGVQSTVQATAASRPQHHYASLARNGWIPRR